MIRRQLELGFENQPGLKAAGQSRGRSSRAEWWFERMRGVVNHAREWPPVPPPPKAPRPPAGQTSAKPPPSGAAPQTLDSSPPAARTNAPPDPGPRRWKFSRARRLIWE
jgi:hypothetical protein